MSSSPTLFFSSGATSGANVSFPSRSASSAPQAEAAAPQSPGSFAFVLAFSVADAGQGPTAPLGAPHHSAARTPSGAPLSSDSSEFPGCASSLVCPSYASLVAGTFSGPLPAVSGAPYPAFAAPSGGGASSALLVSSAALATLGGAVHHFTVAPAAPVAHTSSNDGRSLLSPGAPLAVAVLGNGGALSSSVAAPAAFPSSVAINGAGFSLSFAAASSTSFVAINAASAGFSSFVAAAAAPSVLMAPPGGGAFSRHAAASAASAAGASACTHSEPVLSRLDSFSAQPIMTALSRSAATAASALPAAARGPRPGVAYRNPVSAAPLWSLCRMHVLLLATVAAMMTSAGFSVAHAQGWSTAQLSQARAALAATSVGTVAIFAGGSGKLSGLCLFLVLGSVLIAFVRCVMGTLCLCFGLPCGSDRFLMRATAGSGYSNIVDFYDRATGLWSTARLSQARHGLSATSVGTVAIFAGGSGKLSGFCLFVV
jgi:hypothetical protein